MRDYAGEYRMVTHVGNRCRPVEGVSAMKWLWLGFGVVWGISVWLDSRRRRHAVAVSNERRQSAPAAEAELPIPVREAA